MVGMSRSFPETDTSVPKRIVFMGSDPIAIPMLDMLVDAPPLPLEWAGVFTQPDRPTGRGLRLRANAIKQWAIEHQLTVRQPERCGPEDESWLREQGVDLILVMAYGQMLKRTLIGIPPLGTLNLHASLLPKLRGPSPIATAIACGHKTTGVSLMRIVPKMDAGPVMDCEPVAILPEMTSPLLAEALADASAELLQRNFPAILAGSAKFQPQNENEATYCRIIRKEDARLDFRRGAGELHDQIRAFQPWPGALVEYEGVTLKIGGTAMAGESGGRSGEPGELRVECGKRTWIVCGDGLLEVLSWQRPGGRMMPTADFLRGFSMRDGARFESYALEPLEFCR